MEPPDDGIKAVGTTVRVLEALRDGGTLGVTELAGRLGLPKSTVYSHLRTLEAHGYAVAWDGSYQLSLRFLEYGERVQRSRRVFESARPELDELADETGELVNLLVEEAHEGVYLYLARGDDAVQLDTYPGRRVPLHCTALGKAVLARMSADRRERYLETTELVACTEATTTDPDALRAELDGIRDRGYAFDRGERAENLRCVAAPIVVAGDLEGAISVTGPLPRMRGERFEEVLPTRVVDTASVIEIDMTYS